MSRSVRALEGAASPGGGIHPVDRHVGQVLRARRRALQLTQSAVSDRLGVSFQQLQKYERGTNRISASVLHTLSLVLDLPVARFFDGLPEPESPDDGAARDLVAEMISAPEGPALAEAFLRLPRGADPQPADGAGAGDRGGAVRRCVLRGALRSAHLRMRSFVLDSSS